MNHGGNTWKTKSGLEPAGGPEPQHALRFQTRPICGPTKFHRERRPADDPRPPGRRIRQRAAATEGPAPHRQLTRVNTGRTGRGTWPGCSRAVTPRVPGNRLRKPPGHNFRSFTHQPAPFLSSLRTRTPQKHAIPPAQRRFQPVNDQGHLKTPAAPDPPAAPHRHTAPGLSIPTPAARGTKIPPDQTQ